MKQELSALKPNILSIEEACASGGFTQSELMTLTTCPEKWYLRYGRLLAKRGEFSWALHYGSAIHTMIEGFIHTKGKRVSWELPPLPSDVMVTPEVENDWDYWNEVGKAQTQAYRDFYNEEFKQNDYGDRVEFEPTIEFMGIKLTGKIDALPYLKSQKGYFVMDHKTASRLNESNLEGWTFRFQFMFYMWLASKMTEFKGLKLKGFMPNAIKKPELRQKVNESNMAFGARVYEDMITRPEVYFYRETGLMTADCIENFEQRDLVPKIKKLRIILGMDKAPTGMREALGRERNTDACFAYFKKCPYFDICKLGPSSGMAFMTKKEVKHAELTPE
jgi:PD-(D/E)XK nuclease superfamily